MKIQNKLGNLLNNQKDILKQYEEIIEELDFDNAINENIALKKEVVNYKKILADLQKKEESLVEDNINLKIALKEQMINEKISVLNGSKRKIELYFEAETDKNNNRLKLLETAAIDKLNEMKLIAEKEVGEEKEEIICKIKSLKLDLRERITKVKEKLDEEKEDIFTQIKKEYQDLKTEGISEKVLKKKQKYNDLEVKIGLNWINKIGVILILLGIATAMKYTYSNWLNVYMKEALGFIVGGVFLVIGEWFNRKGKNIFALGLSGGGIGALYLSVFSSYFILKVLSMPVSTLLAILITLVSLILSKRYKSMIICGISLIGGYLPFFSYVFTEGIIGTQIYVSMGYLLILNLLVLGVSLGNRWIYINYLSFLLNIPCFLYLALESSSELISIGYGILTFMMYLMITLVYPVREKIKLKKVDIILLGLNTVINCSLIFELFKKAGYYDYEGSLALIYALIYLGLGQYMKKFLAKEKNIIDLFYLTSLTFTILMIPFQFDLKWLSLGWLIEGIVLISYALKKSEKRMELGGGIILLLSIARFIMVDFNLSWSIEYFSWKYSLLTGGLIYVLSLYVPQLNENQLFKHTQKGEIVNYFKYFTIIHTWLYLMRMTFRVHDQYINLNNYDTFYLLIALALITTIFSYSLSKVKVIEDNVVRGIIVALFVGVDILGIGMSIFTLGPSIPFTERIIPVVILLLYNIGILFNVKELTLRVIEEKGLSIEIGPLVLAIYFLGASIIFLVNQFNLSNIDLIISIFFIIMSFVYITYGFKKDFLLLRRFGLGLAIFSTGKLFLFDLVFLNTLSRIIAYFCFGLVLIGISYLYHKLSGSVEKRERLKIFL